MIKKLSTAANPTTGSFEPPTFWFARTVPGGSLAYS